MVVVDAQILQKPNIVLRALGRYALLPVPVTYCAAAILAIQKFLEFVERNSVFALHVRATLILSARFACSIIFAQPTIMAIRTASGSRF